jgi:hypothetical protein
LPTDLRSTYFAVNISKLAILDVLEKTVNNEITAYEFMTKIHLKKS